MALTLEGRWHTLLPRSPPQAESGTLYDLHAASPVVALSRASPSRHLGAVRIDDSAGR